MEKWFSGSFVFVLVFCSVLFLSADSVQAPLANRSEIRGILVDPSQDTDWNQVVQVAKNYKANALFTGCLWTYGSIYPSQYLSQPSTDQLAAELTAAHAAGLEVHCLMLVNFIWDGFPAGQPIPQDWKVTNCAGNKVNWVDPCHPEVKQFMKNITQELVSKYDIDGFHYDYIRYEGQDMSYSDYCKQDFEADTGITVTTWPDDVCDGGQYWNDFMTWRIKSITDQTKELRDWMTEIKPDLEFSAAVFQILMSSACSKYSGACPTFQRRWIGQDTADWVRQGYLDFASPMIYTGNVNDYKSASSGSMRYFAGGPEGKVPVPIWTSKDLGSITPKQLKAIIEGCRDVGCDGWIIWKYGGPGLTSTYADIRPYFQVLDLPETFSLGSVRAFPTSTDATITWITDRPTTSKVEYSLSPLFNESLKTDYNYQCGCQFPFWDVEHMQGTTLQNSSNVTTHSITLSGLQENTFYYFRVQSTDESGTATSEVYNFTTGSGDYPIRIQGIVTDSETGKPVRAVVYCNEHGTATNANGNYVMKVKSTGSCALTATAAEYKTKSTQITFPSAGSYTQDLALDSSKVNIAGSLIDRNSNPIQAEIKIYEPGAANETAASATDDSGNYALAVKKGVYDLRYDLQGFFGNYWIRFPSADLRLPITNKVKEVTYETNKITLKLDVKSGEVVQINTRAPKRLAINGIEVKSFTSVADLRANTYYYDPANGKLYLKLDSYPKTECIYECCVGEQNYYDQLCSVDKYCSNHVCLNKPECPYECCINEVQYLNKTCTSPAYCVNNVCVDSSAYWKFDEGSGTTATDSSGSGNDGTIHGATWQTTGCKSGSCLSFDGVDDYISVPETDSLNIDGAITLEAWAYPTGWNGDYPGIIAKYWPNGYLIGIANGSSSWCVWLRSTAGLGMSCSDSPLQLNGWTHIAAVRDNSNKLRLYINGTAQSWQPTLGGSLLQEGTDVSLARWGGYFGGLLDELRIYDRALTEAEILAHVNS